MADDRFRGTDMTPPTGSSREVGREWPAWVILVALWAFSLWAMGRLPQRVPMHWDFRGQVNGWGSPLAAALVLPGIATAAYGFILALDWGRLDFSAARGMSSSTTRQVRILMLLMMGILHGAILWRAMHGGVASPSGILLVLSLFFIALGNLMPRLEPNAWVGIRIPPTLEDRDIWKATHRRTGPWVVAAGLAGLPLALLPPALANVLLLPLILLPLLGGVVYAYVLRHQRALSRIQDSEDR